MAVESATYINGLVATNPIADDPRSEGDDHIRLLKAAIKSSFPNVNGAVNPTPAEFNYLVGVTSGIQAQLNALSSTKAPMSVGTSTVFYQTAAPTGWVKATDTGLNHTIRIVPDTAGWAGGSVPFTLAFDNRTVTGTVASHVLQISEIPAHTHTIDLYATESQTGFVTEGNTASGRTTTTGSTGGNGGHSHGFTGTPIDLRVNYLAMILATRNS